MLHAFTNGVDTISAESLEDANAFAREEWGWDDEELTYNPFAQIPDDQIIKIDFVDDEPRHSESAIAAEWATQFGRGVICSTEY